MCATSTPSPAAPIAMAITVSARALPRSIRVGARSAWAAASTSTASSVIVADPVASRTAAGQDSRPPAIHRATTGEAAVVNSGVRW